METLPGYVYVVFVLITMITLLFLYKASGKSKALLITVTMWLVLQSVIALTGFYKKADSIPPRLILAVMPPFIFIIIMFFSKKGTQYINGFNTGVLTLLHSIRILVELVLFWLCSNHLVPELITFEGVNFDIFSGISAPFVYYFGYIRKMANKRLLLLWNFVCLGLLLNVVIHALLSIPAPFQQFAFDQPNIAVLYFPFIWLPCFIIMAVLFSHLVCIRQLLKK